MQPIYRRKYMNEALRYTSTGCTNLAHALFFCKTISLFIKQPHLIGGKPVSSSLSERKPCQQNFHRKILKANFIIFKILKNLFGRGGFEIFPYSLFSFETGTQQRTNKELLGNTHCVYSDEYISEHIRIF